MCGTAHKSHFRPLFFSFLPLWNEPMRRKTRPVCFYFRVHLPLIIISAPHPIIARYVFIKSVFFFLSRSIYANNLILDFLFFIMHLRGGGLVAGIVIISYIPICFRWGDGGGWGKVDWTDAIQLVADWPTKLGRKRQQDEEICSDNQKRRTTREGKAH